LVDRTIDSAPFDTSIAANERLTYSSMFVDARHRVAARSSERWKTSAFLAPASNSNPPQPNVQMTHNETFSVRGSIQWILLAIGLIFTTTNAVAGSILFIGNSFTYAYGSPVRFYRADTVTDLNSLGIGGMPALFKSFTSQAGLDYDVYLETEPGVGVDWHLANKLGVIGRRGFDTVVLHGFSALDAKKPGDPALLVTTVHQMADFLKQRNPAVDLRLMATWPRADLTYLPTGPWFGKGIDVMAREVRAGYDRAAEGSPTVKGVLPVGEAWIRAMQTGVADSNPYDGIEAGKLNLWTFDGYHASVYGYYLEALVVFGGITNRDPRSLGDNECSGFELGLSAVQVHALQQVAFDQLNVGGQMVATPLKIEKPVDPVRCTRGH
jgi:hypothetical protein